MNVKSTLIFNRRFKYMKEFVIEHSVWIWKKKRHKLKVVYVLLTIACNNKINV